MKKIAILGNSPGWERAPFDNKDWEIWACNKFALGLERCERIFEIHRRWNEDDPASPDKKYLSDLRKIEKPKIVYSIIPIGGKANVVLNRRAMFKKYGSTWFSSSFGYMIAQAFNLGFKEVGFWGVDMESREEYVVQQAGVRHFIDLAPFLGIKIHIPDYSLLNREAIPYPDRFETTLALTLENKAQRIAKLIVQENSRLEEEKARASKFMGTLEERYKNLPDFGIEDSNKLKNILANVVFLQENVARLKGELFATQHYKRLFVWNVLPPDIGEETDTDIEDCGPI